MSHIAIRVPIDGAAVHRFIDDVQQQRRICFGLTDVAPVAGLNPLVLEAACQQLLGEHIAFDNTLSMTLPQVQALLSRLGPDGDLADNVLAEAHLREESRPEHLNQHLWAVK